MEDLLMCESRELVKWTSLVQKKVLAKSHPDKCKFGKKELERFGCVTKEEYFCLVSSACDVMSDKNLFNQYVSLSHATFVYPSADDFENSSDIPILIENTLNPMRVFSDNYPKDFSKLEISSSLTSEKTLREIYKNWSKIKLNKRYHSDEMKISDEGCGRYERRMHQKENARIEAQLRINDSEKVVWFLKLAQHYDPRLTKKVVDSTPKSIDSEDAFLNAMRKVVNDETLMKDITSYYESASPKQRDTWAAQKMEQTVQQLKVLTKLKNLKR